MYYPRTIKLLNGFTQDLQHYQFFFDSKIKLSQEHNHLLLHSPLGQLKIFLGPLLKSINPDNNSILLNVQEKKFAKIKAILVHAEKGLLIGHRKILKQTGVWNQLDINNNNLKFKLGGSNPVEVKLDPNILYKSTKDSLDRTLNFYSISLPLVSETCQQIYNLKKPEPYKGTGFHYIDQIIKRKVGKKK